MHDLSVMAMDVLAPESALKFLAYYQRIKDVSRDCTVNVSGKVTFVSEIIKIRGTDVFMVKLLPHLDIIVKRKETMEWHTILVPYTEYTFTKLKPTTVKKGSQSACQVFTVTDHSELFHSEEVDGKVSKVLDPELGVFELDGAVRLYAGCVPAVHKFHLLREGTQVLVHNAHHRISKQYPKVSLYCCMLSRVKIIDQVETKHKGHYLKLGERLKRMLYLEGQSQGQIDKIYELRRVLIQQFLDILSHRLTQKIQNAVLGNSVLFPKDDHTRHVTSRSFIDEFVTVPHMCSLQERSSVNTSACFLTVHDVLEKAGDLPADTLDWQCKKQVFDTSQIIFGMLQLSPDTGQVVLTDSSSRIDVVTCCQHSHAQGLESCNHRCGKTCDSSATSASADHPAYLHDINRGHMRDKFDKVDVVTGTETKAVLDADARGFSSVHVEVSAKASVNEEVCCLLNCPNLQTSILGKVLAVRNCQVISESNFSRRTIGNPNESEKPKCTKYLMLDLREVILVCDTVEQAHSADHKRNFARQQTSDLKDSECLSKDLDNCSSSSDKSNTEHTEIKKSRCIETGNQNLLTSEGTGQADCGGETGSHAHETANRTPPCLHRHRRNNGTELFCRKTNCENQIDIKSTIISPRHNTRHVTSNKDIDDSKVTDTALSQVNCSRSVFRIKPLSSRKRPHEKTDPASCNDRTRMSTLLKTDNTELTEVQKKVDIETRQEDCLGLLDNCSKGEEIVYLERKGALMAEDSNVWFNVDCSLISKSAPEKVVLEFHQEAVRWYSLLYAGSLYRLSVPGQDCAALSDSLPNDKIKKVVQHSKARRCLTVSPLVEVCRVWHPFKLQDTVTTSSIEHILDPSFSEHFVSFVGWIISRALVKPGFGIKSMVKDTDGSGMYSRLHVQDDAGKNDIWVYLNDNSILNPHGLIPGSRVLFSTLERKKSKSFNVYCRFVPLSSVQIQCYRIERPVPVNDLCEMNTDQSVKYLADVWTDSAPGGHMFQCVCDIEKVLKISLKCLCLTCGSLVTNGSCSSPACKAVAGWKFIARATVIVDDSTSVAMVTLTGSSVQNMFSLSHDQWTCLEEEVGRVGEVFIQQYSPSLSSELERFVYMLCEHTAVKQTWLMTLKSRTSVDVNKLNHDEFCMKSFETGSGRVSTHCLPFLQLECVSMTTFEPAHWSVKCLKK